MPKRIASIMENGFSKMNVKHFEVYTATTLEKNNVSEDSLDNMGVYVRELLIFI